MIITRSRMAVVVTIALLLLAAALFTNILPFRQIFAQHEALELAQTQLRLLQEENGTLELEVAALMTDTEVERIAREYFGYVMPGEQAIVIVSPAEEQAAQESEPPVTEDGRPWWQEVWDFLTGRDQTG
ncbi:MAG TPA: septum formation initiator family protein [Acidimicrobiia bacterium]